MFACVRNVLLTTVDNRQLWRWVWEKDRTREDMQTLSVFDPKSLYTPCMTVKWQSLYAGCRCAASLSDIQTMVQNAKEGQLAQGKLSFLKTALSYMTWSHGINVPGCPFWWDRFYVSNCMFHRTFKEKWPLSGAKTRVQYINPGTFVFLCFYYIASGTYCGSS